MSVASANFAFLAAHDERLVRYAGLAERYFTNDANAALLKLRQFAELLTQHAAALHGVYTSPDESFVALLNRLFDRGVLTPEVSSLLHGLRKAGNAAAHAHLDEHKEALHQLKMARKVAIWFHRMAGAEPGFKPGAFVPPRPPADPTEELTAALEEAHTELAQSLAEAEAARSNLLSLEEARVELERRLAEAEAEALVALELAEEAESNQAKAEAAKQASLEQLAALQLASEQASPEERQSRLQTAQNAGADLHLTEAETRHLIDDKLRDVGWEVDSERLRHSKGTRPVKGRNLAIAEWPTASGPADYVLFVGLTPIAVVEAKRFGKDVPAMLQQAERYARDIDLSELQSPGGPWESFKLPFVFATNGRGYLRQVLTASGIWHRDVRRASNHPRPLEDWYSPEGLLKTLQQDIASADDRLRSESSERLPLRDYQHSAIAAVESAITRGQRDVLLAMATGTGKTRTAIALIYRLVKAGRFRRVLFLVDRTSLGEQAFGSFETLKLEQLKSFTQIYDVKELTDASPEPDTRLHFATIQGLVKRVLYPSDGASVPPVDQYDCIVVDECHRGYHLDRELSDAALNFRDESHYISTYRRVLDHFDAVRIGLTATPALHTSEIFGEPVFTYSYRRAVVDGHLVDHEPPIRIVTELAEDGINWGAGENITVFKVREKQVDLFRTPDEVHIEVEGFNKRVITEAFNRAVCQELAGYIDPSLPGKTLVFAATDAHADMLVVLFKEALEELYGSVRNDAVVKITGSAPKPSQRIREFKNELNPSIVVTVDLLTTGIDVPEITNLVFLRRVRSRILYEQMVGRATRQCDAIGKEYFRIFDAVDLYRALEPYSSMKPVVANPSVTFAQLTEELAQLVDEQARAEVLEQLAAKLRRKARRLTPDELERFHQRTGHMPSELADALSGSSPAEIDEALAGFAKAVDWLDAVKHGDGPTLLISEHVDRVRRVERGYGEGRRPEDYLESFGEWIQANLNDVPALLLVTQRPRELTRSQLKELKLALDEAGFTEAGLRTAWRESTNQDIAASVIGFVRQQALGSPLVPYKQRVDRAMQTILASRAWKPPQRKWLERIGKQLREETVVDREALNSGAFQAQGGFERLNKQFNGELASILGEIGDAIWEDLG